MVLRCISKRYEIILNGINLCDLCFPILYAIFINIIVIFKDLIKKSKLKTSDKVTIYILLLLPMLFICAALIGCNVHMYGNIRFYEVEFDEESAPFPENVIMRERYMFREVEGQLCIQINSWLLEKLEGGSYMRGTEDYNTPMKTGLYQMSYDDKNNQLLFRYLFDNDVEWSVLEIPWK